ncbi:hypothetical protein H0A36_25760 [Endozoicomonas sp. SM1973]|uniref:Uncharacterized protein n=1 Tax=Spartinivicinus marinus TaxID=2994442 RepID=A0A853INK5_9GAMM|nr:hypothetical protein [Spartinivicinus marinus]MCX4030271.1 hypothetical protein [Spartinivicinus marinus]MCX4030426.1 hypothetical protein [Spartinivicinus marinus]NYZ69426.1 hypothetical protein [Spartinivicinus marinus]
MGSRTSKNSLLIGNIPVVVSQELAVKIGLDEAIFLNKLHYLLTPKENFINHRLHKYGGKYWVYHTIEELIEKVFPYWCASKVERLLNKLRKLKLIKTAHLHFSVLGIRGVRTLWYTINYEAVSSLENTQASETELDITERNQSVDHVVSGIPQNEEIETRKMQDCTTLQNEEMVEGISTPLEPAENKACDVVGTDHAISLKNNLKNIKTTNVSCSETKQETVDDFVINEMRKKLSDEEFQEFESQIKAKIFDYKSFQINKGQYLINLGGALLYVQNGINFLRNSLRRTAKITAALDKKNTANANYQEQLTKKIQRKTDDLAWSQRSTAEVVLDQSWADGINFDDDLDNPHARDTMVTDVYSAPAADSSDVDWLMGDCYA